MPKKEDEKEEAPKKEKEVPAEEEEKEPSPKQLDRDQLETLRERLQKKYH